MNLIDSSMFQDDTDINCYNLMISTDSGDSLWDVDIFIQHYPRMGKLLVTQFEKGIMSFDLRGLINLTLV
jgi:hypothetical protein